MELNVDKPYETESIETPPARPSGAISLLTTFALSILAALGTCGVLSFQSEFFKVDESLSIGMGAPNEARLKLFAAQAHVAQMNALVTFAIGGGLLGLCLAFVAGECCSLIVRSIAGLGWGAIWGAASGYLGAMLFAVIMPQFSQPGMMENGLAQGSLFAILGLGIGLMFGGFSRSASAAVQGAIVGAIAGFLGGALFTASGILIPSKSTQDLLPLDTVVRLLWLCLPFGAIGALLPSLKKN